MMDLSHDRDTDHWEKTLVKSNFAEYIIQFSVNFRFFQITNLANIFLRRFRALLASSNQYFGGVEA